MENGMNFVSKTCCFNYYMLHGSCTECPNGHYGENCTSICVFPYFGKRCGTRCECDSKSCDYAKGCSSTAIETQSTITSIKTEQGIYYSKAISTTKEPEAVSKVNGKGNADQYSLWVFIIVIAILVILTLTGISIRIGYAQTCVGRFRRWKHTVVITDTVPVRDSDPLTLRPNSDGNEEDVYCEIRESMMIENVEAMKLNVRQPVINQRMPMLSKTYTTNTENTYNRLRYNQSLPNICEHNEYSHGATPAMMGNELSQSENCLLESRNVLCLQNDLNATPSDQYHEQFPPNVYGLIWEQ